MRQMVFVLVGLGTWVAAGQAGAEPNHLDPADAFSVRPHAASTALVAEAKALYSDVARDVAQYEDHLANNRYAKASIRDMAAIGNTSVKLQRLRRAAERLTLLAEPAGADYQLRVTELVLRLAAVTNPYRRSENFLQVLAPTTVQLRTKSQNHQRSLTRIATLFNQGKVELAERAIHEIYDDMRPVAVWQGKTINDETHQPFSATRIMIENKMKEIRTAETQEILDELRAKAAPPFEAIVGAMSKAMEEIKASGSANWYGKQLDGPGLVEVWGEGWRKVQIRVLRCRAMDWARGQSSGTATPSELDRLLDEHETFNREMAAAIAALVAADAARASPGDVAPLYARYLDSIARLSPHLADDSLQKAVQPSLDQLAQKSPEFVAARASYREATDDLLRWRRRAAQAHARRQMSQTPPLEQVFREVAASEPMKRRLLPVSAATSEGAHLQAPAPAIVEHIAEQTKDAMVVVRHVAPAGERGVQSRYFERQYAQLPRLPVPPDALSALRQDLLVADGAPPISLAAAQAIASVEMGHALAVGGRVQGAHLDALLAHNILAGDDASFIPIGPLPKEQISPKRLHEVLVWFDVDPLWVQHEYLFIDLQ